jgi:hypothetical protein
LGDYEERVCFVKGDFALAQTCFWAITIVLIWNIIMRFYSLQIIALSVFALSQNSWAGAGICASTPVMPMPQAQVLEAPLRMPRQAFVAPALLPMFHVLRHLPAMMQHEPIGDVLRALIGNAEGERLEREDFHRRRIEFWSHLGFDEIDGDIREDFADEMRRRRLPPPATGVLRLPQLTEYIDGVESQIEPMQRRGRLIYVLGAGTYLATHDFLRTIDRFISAPQVHEMMRFFANDRVVVVDSSPLVLRALALSRYDRAAAHDLIAHRPNLALGSRGLSGVLTRFVDQVPEALPANLETVQEDFAQVQIQPNTAHYIVATYSLSYALAAAASRLRALALLTRYLDALRVGGRFFMESRGLAFAFDRETIAGFGQETTLRIDGRRYRVFKLSSTSSQGRRRENIGNEELRVICYDRTSACITTGDLFGFERLD